MDKLLNKTLLASTIVTVLLLFWILTKVGQPQVCTNFPHVSSLDIEASHQTWSVPVCGLLLKSDIPLKFESFGDRVNVASAEIASIFRSAQARLKIKPIQVSLKLDQPFLIKVSAHQILVGSDVLSSPGHLEKALVEAALLQNSNTSLMESKVAREILSDFITQTLTGGLDIVDPVLGSSTYHYLKYDHNKLKSFLTEEVLCDSPWRPSSYIESCLDIVRKGPALSKWSLRPLIAHALNDQIKKQSLNQKQKLVRSLLLKLRYQNWSELPQASKLTVSEMLSDAQMWAEFLGLETHFFTEISSQLQQPDLLISQIKQDIEFEENIVKKIFLSRYRIFIKNGELTSLFPLGPLVRLGDIKIHPQHVIIRSPEFVSVEDLGKIKSQDNHVLQILDKNSRVDVISYIQDGARGWISSNLKSAFRIYHLPSIKLAQKWGLTSQHVFGPDNPANGVSKKLRTLFGLDHPLYITKANVSYVPGPLSVIEWYR